MTISFILPLFPTQSLPCLQKPSLDLPNLFQHLWEEPSDCVLLLNYSTLQHGQDLLMVRRERTKTIPYPLPPWVNTHHSRSLLPLPWSKGEGRHTSNPQHSTWHIVGTYQGDHWYMPMGQNLAHFNSKPALCCVGDPGQVRFPVCKISSYLP